MATKPRSAHLQPGPGFRVRMNFPRPSPDIMRDLAPFPTPDISDMLNRLYAVSPAVRCLTGDKHRICGPACTVKVFPGDNLMVHKALDVLEPGDVVVIDAGGSSQNAVLGDLISMKARHRGAAAFVVDGFVRDLPNIAALDLPVFARGTTPIGPLHRGPGEINFPICCGGVVVNPGDLIVGDAMGVVVVPQGIARDLIDRLRTHEEANADYFESVRRGVFSNEWVDTILTNLECPIIKGQTGAAAAVAAPAAPVASTVASTGTAAD
jgi:RraA family protein